MRLEHIRKTFRLGSRQIEVLEQVSFVIRERCTTAILGPTGCGKTTLLRIIAGLEHADSGRLETPAGDVTRVSFVFQKPVLMPWRTVMGNVLLPAEIERTAGALSTKQRAQELLSTYGLAEFSDAYPHQLSGGMTQRMLLARAMMTRPQLLCLDEPFSALDELTRESLWVHVRTALRQDGTTALLVTHNVVEAVFLSDWVVVLSGRPSSVVAEQAIALPLTRNLELLDSGKFHGLVATIRSKLERPVE